MAKILVVEDDEINRKIMEFFLIRKGGHTAVFSDDMDQILSHLQTNEINLIIMDITLNNTHYIGRPIDGIDMIKIIHDRIENPPPILLATAHAMSTDLARCGADDYIAKPIESANALLDKVKSLLKDSAC